MARDNFLFFFKWANVLENKDPNVRLEVYDAIIRYAQSGTLSELKPQAQMAFDFIKEDIDKYADRYDAMIEARREAGRKGGDAKADNAKQNVANVANAIFAKQNVANVANAIFAKQNVAKEKGKGKNNIKENLLKQVKESAASAEPPQPSVCGEEKSDKDVTPPTAHKEQDAARRFRRPTVDEVAAYVAAQGYAFSAAAFCAYYDSVGWVIGRGKPMKDWRAACRTWQQRHKEEQQQGRGAPPSSPAAAAYRDPSKFINDRWREEG